MSGFAKQQLAFGRNQPVHKYKLCNKCEEMKPPEGGIQMNPSKWYCAACWVKRAVVRNLNDISGAKREE
jgi:hypothetical protein